MGEPTNERQLWQDFQNGDDDAYTQLYRLHVRAMYRYGLSLVPVSEAFVLDCIHDVFTEIWAKRTRLSVPDNVRYYLLKSLKTRILHLLKRQERPHQFVSQDDFDDLWTEPANDELQTQEEESINKQELIKNLISQLPPRQQEAIRLRFVENLEYTQIAELLSMNRQSAQNLVFRAVEKLRNWLLPSLFYLFSRFF
ncbi:sigma-70 family RNA polymerase sigma factor [Runella sp. MFBS21]|uniref:RNA polymerase sigma factor n=1 Tax=Runella sp. MFBS21 TaxID=3034018 RepID=UPI0023F73103|nr:sigma-70 family RNA polymerase sigma factor [Runella sp. MFBS21]MDF7817630.1 sigma-70 family RNA polymerase sigma factor [Runella sp. MFBS21]